MIRFLALAEMFKINIRNNIKKRETCSKAIINGSDIFFGKFCWSRYLPDNICTTCSKSTIEALEKSLKYVQS